MKITCNICGDKIDKNGIIETDGSALCYECRKSIFEKPKYFNNKTTGWLCGNCECISNTINQDESGALKCSACGYVDGEKLFEVNCLFF